MSIPILDPCRIAARALMDASGNGRPRPRWPILQRIGIGRDRIRCMAQGNLLVCMSRDVFLTATIGDIPTSGGIESFATISFGGSCPQLVVSLLLLKGHEGGIWIDSGQARDSLAVISRILLFGDQVPMPDATFIVSDDGVSLSKAVSVVSRMLSAAGEIGSNLAALRTRPRSSGTFVDYFGTDLRISQTMMDVVIAMTPPTITVYPTPEGFVIQPASLAIHGAEDVLESMRTIARLRRDHPDFLIENHVHHADRKNP